MEIQMRFILTTCIVNILLTSVPVLNEAVLGSVHGAGNVQKDIGNLFDSVARINLQRGETFRDLLKHDVKKEQEAFDSMKDELWILRNRNADRKKNEGGKVAMVKRETDEENYDPKTHWRDGRYRDGRDLFQTFNPFNKRRYALPIPKRENLNNETYQAAMDAVLKLWFQQRYNLEQVFQYKRNITCMVPELKMYAFDEQLKSLQDLIDEECLVIQDILWGEKKEFRTPLDKTLIRRLENGIKVLKAHMEENLPDALKNCNKYVQEDLDELRGFLKRSLEFLTSHYARIEDTIKLYESGNEGAVTAMKWIQMGRATEGPSSASGNDGDIHDHSHGHTDEFDYYADHDPANESAEWAHDARLSLDPTHHNVIEMVLRLWWSQRGFVHNIRHETDSLKNLKLVTMREVNDQVNEIESAVEQQISSMSFWENPENMDVDHILNETVLEEMLRMWTKADQSFSTYQIDDAAEICSRLRHEFRAAREDLSHRWQRMQTLLSELTEQEEQRKAEEEKKEQQRRAEAEKKEQQRRDEEENKCES